MTDKNEFLINEFLEDVGLIYPDNQEDNKGFEFDQGIYTREQVVFLLDKYSETRLNEYKVELEKEEQRKYNHHKSACSESCAKRGYCDGSC